MKRTVIVVVVVGRQEQLEVGMSSQEEVGTSCVEHLEQWHTLVHFAQADQGFLSIFCCLFLLRRRYNCVEFCSTSVFEKKKQQMKKYME